MTEIFSMESKDLRIEKIKEKKEDNKTERKPRIKSSTNEQLTYLH